MATLEELLAEKQRRLSGATEEAEPTGRLQVLLAEKERRQPAPIEPVPVEAEQPQEASLADTIRSFLPPGLQGPEPGPLGEAVGITARAGIEGVAAIPGIVMDPIVNLLNAGVRSLGRDPEFVTVSEAANLLADKLGLPPGEGFGFEVAKGMAGVSPGVAIGRGMATAAGPVTRRVGQVLAETPGIQTVAGATGAAGAEVAEELGAGPGGQLAAAILAGGATPAAFPRAAARTAARTDPTRVAAAVGEPVAAQAVVTTTAPSLREVAAAGRKAVEGGLGASRARRVLAEQAAPDPKVIEAAKRLEIEEFLQPDHVSTNQSFREFSQAVKSIPGSQARAAEIARYEAIGKRADNLIKELGGATDLSKVDVSVRNRLSDTIADLEDNAAELYGKLRETIPAKAPAAADNLLAFLNNKADELGGVQNLQALERRLLKQLSPTKEGVLPTYALLDNIRKQLVQARVRKEGVFKDADSGLIKKLEGELLKDQQIVAGQFNSLELFDAARTSVAVRKGIESDMISLFGKNLDRTIIGDLSAATKKLSQGDTSKFIKMVKALPVENRQEVVASGLNTAFGKNANNGQLNFTTYAKWYEGLLKNKRAFNALMSNLPPEARKSLSDLFRVSNGIRKASRERITTGRIQAVIDEIRGADNLMSNIYGLAKRSSVGAGAEVITTAIGLPGAGIAAGIASALTKGKPNVMQAADELIMSPEFIKASSKVTPEAAANLAKTSAFKRYREALGNPSELSRPEDWILSAFRATAQSQPEEQ